MEQSVTLPSAEELSCSPPIFTQPQHLTSFSYSGRRKLLLSSSGKQDASLKFYKEPPRHADLRRGYSDCVRRDESIAEGLDALLECLLDMPVTDSTDRLLNSVQVITWRGMMTRLCTALYEEKEGWGMSAQMIDNTLYLEDFATAASLASKANMSADHRLASYFGYSFESYCTTSHPQAPLRDWGGDVNTNEQWCSVTLSSLEEIKMILGGEVDCITPDADLQKPSTAAFIELKTNIVIRNDLDVMRFERYKLLKFYMQSFLLGVPRVIVGFRTREGVLDAIQPFDTLDVPSLVKGKPHSWDASRALHSGYAILGHLTNTLSNQNSVKEAEQRLTHSVSTRAEFRASEWQSWPLYRIRFTPGQAGVAAQLHIREVSLEDRLDRPATIGVVTHRWFEGIMHRRARISGFSKP